MRSVRSRSRRTSLHRPDVGEKRRAGTVQRPRRLQGGLHAGDRIPRAKSIQLSCEFVPHRRLLLCRRVNPSHEQKLVYHSTPRRPGAARGGSRGDVSAMPGRRHALPRHPGAICIVHLAQEVPIGKVRIVLVRRSDPWALHRGGAGESVGTELSNVRCVLLVPGRADLARIVDTGRTTGSHMGLRARRHLSPTSSRSTRAAARFLSAGRSKKVLASSW